MNSQLIFTGTVLIQDLVDFCEIQPVNLIVDNLMYKFMYLV